MSASETSVTKQRLLDAAEQLFAERGVHATPSRDIVARAGQRNESALQYHFGSREGLMDALHRRRLERVQAARFARLASLLETNPDPSVRELCLTMVLPVVELCREDPGFIDYLKVFGQVALAPSDRMAHGLRYEADSARQVARRIVDQLKLPRRLAALRFDSVSRILILSLCQRARHAETFRGKDFDLFFNNLVDMVCGMLVADVSDDTNRALGRSGADR
jgi:AcrR family transcriptional regulator